MLAPSLHNVQPWRFAVAGDTVEMRVGRSLPVADPGDQAAWLACGFALFCLRVAAWAVGRGLAVEVQGETVRVRPGEGSLEFDWEPEFACLPYLRLDHRPFRTDQAVDVRELRARLVSGFPRGFQPYAGPVGVRWLEDPGARTLLASKVEKAARARWSQGEFRKEVAPLGSAGRLVGLPEWLATWLLPYWSPADRVARDEARRASEGPVLVVLGGRRDERADWLAAGECLGCLVLTGRWQGLSASLFPDVVASGRVGLAEQSGLEFPMAVLRLGIGGHLPAPGRLPMSDVVAVR